MVVVAPGDGVAGLRGRCARPEVTVGPEGLRTNTPTVPLITSATTMQAAAASTRCRAGDGHHAAHPAVAIRLGGRRPVLLGPAARAVRISRRRPWLRHQRRDPRPGP